jgi:hypothetical protein
VTNQSTETAGLTFEKIMEAKRRLDEIAPSPFDSRGLDPFGLRPFMGMRVYEAPDPPPKIQLSAECAELVGPEFAAQVNCWLLIRFGRRESIFDGDRAFILGGYGMVLSKANAARLWSIIA